MLFSLRFLNGLLHEINVLLFREEMVEVRSSFGHQAMVAKMRILAIVMGTRTRFILCRFHQQQRKETSHGTQRPVALLWLQRILPALLEKR